MIGNGTTVSSLRGAVSIRLPAVSLALLVTVALLVTAGLPTEGLSSPLDPQGACSFIRGNITTLGDPTVVDLNDGVEIPALLFLGNEGSVPECLEAADVNDNGLVEFSDYTYLVEFRFNDGPPPPAPFPEAGTDDTDLTLSDEPDPRFSLTLGSAAGVPNNTGIAIPLTMTNDIPVTGLTAVFEYDPNALRIDEIVTEEGTLLSAENAEYIVATFDNTTGVGFVAALKDFATPFGFQSGESSELPAGEDQLIATIKCGIVVTAGKGFSAISFANDRRAPSPLPEDVRPGIHNLVFLGSSAARPTLSEAGGVEIRRGFIRGDVNQDKGVDISDPVSLLDWIFQSGSRPSCMDAADANNDTSLDLSDGIWLLNFLFRGGPQPPEPYPQPGVDPSDDGSGSIGCDEDDEGVADI